MPPISPCGRAVDWLRSCHSGTFRFYANNLSIRTRGRFYFTAPDAPFLPFPHDFGSATWRVGDEAPPLHVGEDDTLQMPWSPGRLGVRFPPLTPVGSRAEFSGSLTWPFAEPDRTSILGVDSRCWTNVNEPLAAPEEICALDSCCYQAAMVRLMQLVYTGDWVTLETFFRAWIGPQATFAHFEQEGISPAQFLVIHPKLSIAVISGTTTFQQFATFAFEAQQGPTDQGIFSALPVWNEQATLTDFRLTAAGADPLELVLLVGHSYGAAISQSLASRYIHATADRDVCVFTFGSPKPGDSRMRALLKEANTISLSNTGDLVTILPPSKLELLPFAGLVSVATALAWAKWTRPPVNFQIQADGSGAYVDPPIFDAQVLFDLIVDVINNQPLDIIVPHRTAEYLRRLLLRCPAPCWPMTPELWQILFKPSQFGLTYTPIPAAELVLDSPTPLTPGPSCATALELPLGTVWSGTTTGATEQWFKVAVLDSTLYHYAATAVDWFELGNQIWHGPDCASLTFLTPVSNLTPCQEHTPGADEFIFLQISGGFFGDTDFTVVVDEGAC